MISWFLDHLTPIVAILIPVYGLKMGQRLAARLWRDGWGPVPRETILSAYGFGAIVWLVYGIFSPRGPLYWSMLVSLAAALIPTLVVILTRPDSAKAGDREN